MQIYFYNTEFTQLQQIKLPSGWWHVMWMFKTCCEEILLEGLTSPRIRVTMQIFFPALNFTNMHISCLLLSSLGEVSNFLRT